jgi:peptidoglycan L-alanyl-D-glutamate endopeptidase CwlK
MLWQLTLYFVAAVSLMSLVFFPPARAATLRHVQSLKLWILGACRHKLARCAASLRKIWLQTRANAITWSNFLLQRKRWLALSLVAVIIPPVTALTLRHWHILEYQEDLRSPNDQIAILLRGELLVPPAPLPPTVFLTTEVELIRPKLSEASRDWNLLDADFKQRLLLVYKMMREQHGYEMVLIEGYRSPQRQALLAQWGAGVVTHADAYQSYHQYGLAADSAFFRDGRLIISEKDPWAMRGYQLYGQLAESAGLTWGGRWKLMDFGHVELKRPGTLGRKL